MFEEKSRSLSQEKVKDVSEDELKSHWSCDQVSAQAQQVALQGNSPVSAVKWRLNTCGC